MRSRYSLLAVSCLVLLASPSPSSGADRSAEWSPKISPVLRSLLEEARDPAAASVPSRRQRILVTLEPAEGAAERADSYRTAEGLEALQNRVWEAQEQVLRAHSRGHLSLLHRYESLYGFSAVANEAAVRELAAMPEVVAIEEMPVYELTDSQSHPLTGVDAMHTTGYDGTGVTIAIIDDGIDHDHAAFGGSTAFPNAKIIGGYDIADNDANPTIDCAAQRHGTATTGIAVGNGGGVTGTARAARAVFVKVQRSSECGALTFSGDLVAAINWTITNRLTYGIKVVSMSLGFGLYTSVSTCESSSTALRNAVNAAHASGMVLVAASGNNAATNAISRPACMTNVISVGAVYDTLFFGRSYNVCSDGGFLLPDRVTCYSNSASFLDLLGPAECALTAHGQGTTNTCFGGTSAATPFVAGVAASLLERDPNLNHDAVRGLLTRNGRAVTDHRNGLVKPRVDAAASLRELFDLYACQWSAAVKESSGIAYTCPTNKVMIGRQHNDDENGNTFYYCCSAGVPQATTSSCAWSAYLKESSGIPFNCPFNQVMTGRQHHGDENGNTRYQCCNLSQNGTQVPINNCAWSGAIKESDSLYRCLPNGKVMVGRQHNGDENGNSFYFCCSAQWPF